MKQWETRRKRLEDEMRKFGSVASAADQSRETWGWLGPERLWQDVRFALRSFRKDAGFTMVALLSLMLGIGASAALFSVVYGVLIAPYPYARPNQIWAPAVLGPHDALRGWHWYSQREMEEIQKLPAFADVMATSVRPVLLTGGINPENFYGVFLTGGAFNFLEVKPLIGRTLQPFDIGPGGEPAPVVVLSYGFWQRFFSGDPHAIGRTITLDDVPHTIVGVMPPRFGWWTNEAFWLPLRTDLKDTSGIAVIMRLVPGVTQHAAEQQLNQLNIRLAAERPAFRWRADARRNGRAGPGGAVRHPALRVRRGGRAVALPGLAGALGAAARRHAAGVGGPSQLRCALRASGPPDRSPSRLARRPRRKLLLRAPGPGRGHGAARGDGKDQAPRLRCGR